MKRDFNLLLVFDAIASTGSVTGAAQRLGLSQPAVSHALNRLRHHLDDQLFERGNGGLVPTPRARRMLGGVSDVVALAEALFRPDIFDPLSSKREFVIATSDYADLTLLPSLTRLLRRSAPGIRLRCVAFGVHTAGDLAAGVLDLSFWGARPPERSTSLQWMKLFSEDHVGIAGFDQPVQRQPVTLEHYLAHGHITVSLRDPGLNRVDQALAALGHRRTIAFTTHSFASVPHCLPGTDLIASLPRRLHTVLQPRDLGVFELPFDVPAYDYGLIWHDRSHRDAGHAWLRSCIAELFHAAADPVSQKSVISTRHSAT